MFSGLESPFHLLIVLAIAILVLGVFKPKQIPEAARSLGSGIRHIRTAISGQDDAVGAPSETRSLPADGDSASNRGASEKPGPSSR